MNSGPPSIHEILDWLSQPHPLSNETLQRPPTILTADDWVLALSIFAGTLLRRGPEAMISDGFSFGDFFSTCQRMVDLGWVPIRLLQHLRLQLDTLEEQQIEQGFLPHHATAWWSPLPPTTPLEECWSQWITGIDERLHESTLAGPEESALLKREAVLAYALLEDLFPRLEQGFANEQLALQREGVGRSGTISEARGDQVQYFSGNEPWLLKQFPALACLMQHMAGNLGHRLAKRFDKKDLHPPQRAMLARYPAPNQGYRRHVDNPGGSEDNGRSLTIIFYLNPPSHPVQGGNLKVWPPINPSKNDRHDSPRSIPAESGTMVAFDSRTIPHEVAPLQDGPPRWALSFWFNDQAPVLPKLRTRVPLPTMTELMIHQEKAQVPEDRLWFHCFDSPDPKGSIIAPTREEAKVEVGILATTYAAGTRLEHWCAHHLAQGAKRLFLVFDKLENPTERRQSEKLAEQFPQLTILAGETLAREYWPGVPKAAFDYADVNLAEIAFEGNHSSAVCARQTLNASYVLTKIQQGELASVDWLVHIDDDEFLYCLGPERGGTRLDECLATAQAQGKGIVRFLNHELLLPWTRGQAAFFKVNPRLAAAKLGTRGWQAMVDHLSLDQAGPRPYFSGYHNGKAAVHVNEGLRAAGVHGWSLRSDAQASGILTVAGPVVLHAHCFDEDLFCQKYLRKSQHRGQETRLFKPSPLEEAATKILRNPAPLTENQQHNSLRRLYRSHLHFSPTEVEWLSEAGLLVLSKIGPIICE